MKPRVILLLPLAAVLLAACGDTTSTTPAAGENAGIATDETPPVAQAGTVAEAFEIAPGLTARILKPGTGDVAEAGDSVEVDYTGWLYDPEATDNRGDKFDSSIDRGQRFQFPLGAGRVIKGWDQGVAGMQIGEIRELTIAPEMAYGDRGAGNVIPPGATLVFEIELFAADSMSDAASE